VDFVGAVGAVFVEESLEDGFARFGDAETVSSEDGEGGVDGVRRTRGRRFFIVIEHRGGRVLEDLGKGKIEARGTGWGDGWGIWGEREGLKLDDGEVNVDH